MLRPRGGLVCWGGSSRSGSDSSSTQESGKLVDSSEGVYAQHGNQQMLQSGGGACSPAHIPGLCRRKLAGRRGWESRLSTWLPPSSCEYPDVFLVTAFPHPPVPTQQTLDSLPKYIRITWPLPPLALLPSHSPHSPSLELCILWSVLLECSSPPLRVARSSHLLDLNLHFTSFEDLL